MRRGIEGIGLFFLWTFVAVLCLSTAAVQAALVGHWKLDDGETNGTSTTTAVDSAPSPLNGTLTGSAGGNNVFDDPTWVTGIDGGAAEFGDDSSNTNNKLDDVIEISSSGLGSKLDISGSLTIAAWIKLNPDSANGTGSTRHIAGKDQAFGPTNDSFGINHTMGSSADLLRFMVADNDVDTIVSSTDTLTNYTADSNNDGWVHVAGVFVPGTSMKLYINGLLDNELTTGVPAEAESVPTPFTIGRLNGSDTHSFYGSIDDVRLYDQALSDTEVFAVTGIESAVPRLRVNRNTGAMTLENLSFASSALKFRGYSITSSLGALDYTGWRSIADYYDSDSGGFIDSNDTWTILTDTDENITYEDLSEFEFGGDGGVLAIGAEVDLSLGGAWIPSPVEDDLFMEITLAGENNGTIITVPIVYEGNGNEPLLRSDLDHDGDIDGDDWTIFQSNFPSPDLSSETSAQAYVMGDVSGPGGVRDQIIDVNDFLAFKEDFIAENGASAFAALVQGVPEPSSLLILLLGALGLFTRRGGYVLMKKSVVRSTLRGGCLVLALAMVPSIADADLIAHWKLDDGETNSSTTTAVDEVAPPSNGTLENFTDPSTKWGTGISGGALTFGANGTGNGADGDDVVTTPSTGKLDITGALTISAWVLLNDDGGKASTRHIAGIDRAGGATGDAYSLKHQMSGGSDTLQFLIANASEGGDTNLVSTDTLTNYTAASVNAGNGGWVHVAGVYVPGTSMELYINGVSDILDTNTSNVPSSIDSVTTPFNIGRLDNSTSHSFHGMIDDVRVYNEALNAEQILDLWTDFSSLNFTALIQPATGEMILRNNTNEAIEFDYYRLDSNTSAFKPTDGSWNSLSDQNLDPVNGGDDPGETWDEGNNSNASVLTEVFLQGSTTLEVGESVNIGRAYDPQIGGLPTFEYHNIVKGQVLGGLVRFMLLGDMNGDGDLDELDVPLFVQALTNRLAYDNAYSEIDADVIGDFDGNGLLDMGDIAQFSDAVADAISTSAAASAVPEPAGVLLFLLATSCFVCARRQHSSR